MAQRTPEIGVRMALGAASRDGMRLVVRGTTVMLIAGLIAATAGALVTTRIWSLSIRRQTNDAAAPAIAGCVLTASAVLASYIPARRAARTSPAVTLRAK